MTKEQVYDAEIAPLVSQISEICKRHKIPTILDFCLDAETGLKGTTILRMKEWPCTRGMLAAMYVLSPD